MPSPMANRAVQLVDGPGHDRWITLPIIPGSDTTAHVYHYRHQPPARQAETHAYIQSTRTTYLHAGIIQEGLAA